MDFECPICGSNDFRIYNTRENARCHVCGSLERTRYLWAVVKRLDLVRPEMRVLHVAPEECLMQILGRESLEYFACDIEPTRYSETLFEVHAIDLCHDLAHLERDRFDLIIHNHVLEHIQCDVEHVLRQLARVLKPEGNQLFSVPFRGDETRENLLPLAVEVRRELFGQEDHMRLFGRSDFPKFLCRVYGEENFRWDWQDLVSVDELRKARVPEHVVDVLTGETIFHYKKPIDWNE